jgi:hypothetical protein
MICIMCNPWKKTFTLAHLVPLMVFSFTSVTFLKFFLNTIIQNIKIHNILDFPNFVEPNKSIQFFLNENIYLIVSYDFSKFNGSRKIKVLLEKIFSMPTIW